jgi:peptidyl-dipeptidase Dcp
MAGRNPFLSESPLPYRFPPFDAIGETDYLPAFASGMSSQLEEIDAIASNPAEPTFENTIVAMERSGQLLARVKAVFSNLKEAHINERIREIDREMAPRLAAHDDAIHLNPALFARISAVHGKRASLGLDGESNRLVERYHSVFVRAGALLSGAGKARLRALNAELAALITAFNENVLDERNASSVLVQERSELAGLPEPEVERLELAARFEKKPGGFLIPIANTTGQEVLHSLENRALRQRIMEASLARGARGGPFDNRATVLRIVEARAELASLIGFESFAAYSVANQMAGSVGAVAGFLSRLLAPCLAKAGREASEIQSAIDGDLGGFTLRAWDWSFFSEKVRRARYAFDESLLSPYLELNRVLEDGLFFAAGRLYGITFKERRDLPVYHPDVRVFEVFESDGSLLALILMDFFARPSKKGGAWMSAYVPQSALFGTKPVVAIHLNVPKPQAGQPALLTYDHVTTFFHEFGHALHGIFSNVRYPLFSGTNVPQDFAEFPSQVHEMWAVWPEVVKNYARHFRTGEPMPGEMLDRMLASRKFNMGFATTEYLKAALLDQAWHAIKPGQGPADVAAFEEDVFFRCSASFAPIPPRYRSTYFAHAFTEDYAGRYYSYIWSEILVAEGVEWFERNGGLLRPNGERLRASVLSRGDSVEPALQFREFAGRDPDLGPLIRRRGLGEGGS